MNKWFARLALTCAAGATFVFLAGAQSAGAGTAGAPPVQDGITKPQDLIGKPFPAFEMTTIDGKKLTNKSMMGKVYIVDFWATWCPPCKKAAPHMQTMFEELKDQNFMVIGADCWERGADGKPNLTKDPAVGYQKEHGYTYTFTYGNDDFAKSLKITGIPTFFLVNEKGVVQDVFVGFGEGSQIKMKEKVTAALAAAANN